MTRTLLRGLCSGLICVAIALLAVAAAPSPLSAETPSAASRQTCAALAKVDFEGLADAPTQVIDSKWVGGSVGSPAGYCEVNGYVAPQVGFVLRLPEHWNGRFLQIGNGGTAGTVSFLDFCPIDEGYACIITDMGHAGLFLDGVWASQNLQAKVDWGFRATHVVTLAGKAITARYYGRDPSRAYFVGCSTGGRQALQEAQHFPWDYDGLIAGAPAISMSKSYMNIAWQVRVNRDAAGKAILGPEQAKLLTDQATALCGGDDGVKDGLVGDPLHCPVDPRQLACSKMRATDCLSEGQVEVALKLYAGAQTSGGKALTTGGILPGAESVQLYGNPEADEFLGLESMRYLFFWPEAGPKWTFSDFDFDRDFKRMGLFESLASADNPDLRAFKSVGGKLILFQGLRDPLTRQSVDYYEAVERMMGGHQSTQAFARLFTLPGVNHCSGGIGADAADFLGALRDWVEEGRAPDKIVAGHLKGEPPAAYPYRQLPRDPAQVAFTRPVYPYPARAKYVGKGDVNEAANFKPVEAQR